jgi:hypothetical protein
MKFEMTYLWGIVPLILIELGLILYCLLDWLKRKKFRWIGKWGWLALFALVSFFGAILYIILIKNNDDN